MRSNRESSAESPGSTRAVTRRRALLGAGGVAATALAGCLGFGASGSSGGSPDSNLPCFDANGGGSSNQPLPTPVKGNPNADVTVAVYEDFGCPHCRDYVLEVVPELEKQYIKPGTIRYEHHDFPIPVQEPASYTAANAARAAQALVGDSAFWVYLTQLFKNQDSLGPEFYASLADQTCLGKEEIRSAATNREYKKTVMNDRKQGIEKSVNATPTVFVNGKSVKPTVDAVSSAIDAAK